MNHSEKDQLDPLLENWANKTACSAEDLETLRKRIVEQKDANTLPVGDPFSSPIPHARWRVIGGMTAAAAVVFVTLGLWYSKAVQGPEIAGRKSMANAAQQPLHPLPGKTVSTDHQRQLWQEHHSVFGAQLAWIAERDGKTEIGLSDPATRSDSKNLITVRLVLWKRPENGGQWQKLQSFYVVAGQEQLVQMASSENNSCSLEIWAYPLNEQLVSVDLRFQPEVATVSLVNESILQRVGEYTKVCSFEQDGFEYRLYQTADLIGDDLG